MAGLSNEQIAQYRRHVEPYGASFDGRPRFMHTRPAPGSEPNRPAAPRTLFISVYSAGDAVPCAPNPLPSLHEGLFVRGSDPHRVRAEDYEIEVPEFPKTSLFAQQPERERVA